NILDGLRSGEFDVLIGVNLLREGLDLPEVSLVAILDADKEGFLRSHRSLTQTVGRAARNLNGEVIMYADKITDSMRRTIDETERRRAIQLAYNEKNGITPQAIVKARNVIVGLEKEQVDMDATSVSSKRKSKTDSSRTRQASAPYAEEFAATVNIAADPVVAYMNADELQRNINKMRAEMLKAAKEMEFITAAKLRDEIIQLEQRLENLTNGK
ncbi:MAG: UvrB/UvrC motif-containing protein, partial [Muribaculaceae bacterium]|nr:UvrB/UvrC motif-containing protein [Muribaculaceae bacterium]